MLFVSDRKSHVNKQDNNRLSTRIHNNEAKDGQWQTITCVIRPRSACFCFTPPHMNSVLHFPARTLPSFKWHAKLSGQSVVSHIIPVFQPHHETFRLYFYLKKTNKKPLQSFLKSHDISPYLFSLSLWTMSCSVVKVMSRLKKYICWRTRLISTQCCT